MDIVDTNDEYSFFFSFCFFKACTCANTHVRMHAQRHTHTHTYAPQTFINYNKLKLHRIKSYLYTFNPDGKKHTKINNNK